MVEVNQLRKKPIYFIILGRVKQKTSMNAAERGGCNPLNPSPGSAPAACSPSHSCQATT